MTGASALILILSLSAAPAAAATWPVDDSASLPGRATAVMQSRPPGPDRAGGAIAEGQTTVRLVLNTARWVRRSGRIYMLAASPPSGPVEVSWTTQGRLLPGSMVTGERGLVYAGPITAAAIADTVTVRVATDARRLVADEDLAFQFEIDVE